jgi:hypothetical protein
MGEGQARNALCWCGSGRKLKHCHRTEKQRTTALVFDFGKPVAPDRVGIDPATGAVTFLRDGKVLSPKRVVQETTYERKKGPKVVNRIPFDLGQSPTVTLPVALWPFQRIYAIDTNTRLGATGKISVGVATVGRAKPVSEGMTLVGWEANAAFEFRNAKGNAERHAWRTLIDRVRHSSDFQKEWRIGLIVDSELEMLTALNARTQPVCDDFLLPENFQFIYASSDTQADSVINRMLALSDTIAGRFVDWLVAKPVPDDGLCQVRDLPFTHFRFWVRVRDDSAAFEVIDPRAKVNSLMMQS